MLPVVDATGTPGSALEDADDAFLVARSADGDLRAFSALLRRYNGVLRRYVDRLTRNAADTDDVLQDTALVAWRRLETLQEPAKVRGWLIQIASREALRHVTARPPEVELTDEIVETLPGSAADADGIALRQALQSALDALPQQQARCWILREVGGFRYSEIAEQLQIPESTVRGALVQARKAILRAMEGQR
ncbi:RNA polymerase sigma factor [Amnibacterium soli]|uniref:RNA polymerase sigma factor n=1 Tax=Amnibacterium soli TaxID=1282736 RepID=A0ABP8ZI14_9MICO